jgi:hypothetical protein
VNAQLSIALALLALNLTGCVVVRDRSTGSPPAREDPQSVQGEARRVDTVLNDLHDAASKADGARYFALFEADGVFLGTDATERWTTPEFRSYAQARFDTGQGWTYTPTSRHVFVSRDGRTAWFDEMLHNAKYGECRGSGVLTQRDNTWRIAQYNLSVPVPNDLLPTVADMIRAQSRTADPNDPYQNR